MNDFYNKQICSYKDIDRFGFTCDVCGRKVNGCHYINGMSFCEKCYQETFGKDNQQNEIQQLKQQLAEKQNTINEINKEFVQAVHDWKTLCAEKDKEIESLTNRTNRYENMFRSRINRTGDMQKDIELYVKQLAIQELEKVKDTIKHFCNIHNDEYYGVKSQVKGIEQDVCDQINQQIKELKGE